GVWSTVTDQAPGKAPDAIPAKRPWADVAAYSSPLTVSVDVVAAIAAAGPAHSAAAAARTGTIHPCQRMTYRTSSRPAGRTPRGMPRRESLRPGPITGDCLAGRTPLRAGHHRRVVTAAGGAGQMPRCQVRHRPRPPL